MPQLPPTKTGEQIQAEWDAEAMALPKEKRQEFLDYMWQGMTLGEAYKKAGITFNAALSLVKLNIEQHSYLRRESV